MATIERTVAIAGFDCRIDEDGNSHPWRMVIWRKIDDGDIVIRRIGALPDGLRWVSIPRDPVYGDLQRLPEPPLVTQVAEIAGEILTCGIHAILVADETCAEMLFESLRWHGIEIKEVEGYMDKISGFRDNDRPRGEFAGEAGREIATIRQITETGNEGL